MSDHLTSLFERYRQHNDLRALAKLFDAVAPELASVAAHMSRTADEAEDLVQATFLSAIERSANFDASRPVVPWFLGILALHARKQRARAGRDLDPERVRQPGSADPEREAQGREISSAVGSAVEQLDPNYAPLVRRYLLDGATASTLAQEFQLNPITARVRLHRGLKQLRARLPVGISLAGLGSTLTLVDLSSVRASVLRRASQITGSAVPVASIASGALVLALLTPVALAIPAWLVWRVPGSVSEHIAMVPAEASAEPASLGVVEPSPLIRELVETLVPEPASKAALTQARLRGRLLRPDGSPAVGAVVKLRGMVGNSDLAEQFGLPIQWTDPAPLACGEQGEFELSFDAPPAYQFRFSADAEGCASANWWWKGFAAEELVDLGDVQLEEAGTLVVRLKNDQGQALGANWTVRAEAPPPNRLQGREKTYLSAEFDQVGGAFTLEDLPARRVTLSASTQNFASIEKQVIEVIAGVSTPVELVYSGSDPAARIGMVVRMPHGVFQAPSPDHIWLTQAGQPPRHPQVVPGYCNFAFDGLAPGLYDVNIDDPRFAPWSKAAVQPGAVLGPKLLGTAALSLRILQPDQTPYLGRYRLRLAKLGQDNVGNVNLVSINEEPPANGLVGGIMPGDYEFEISFPEQPSPRRLSVPGLAAHETRELDIPVGVPLGVQGRVVTSDGQIPMAGIEVQVTRGSVAGHTMGGNGLAYVDGIAIPPLDASTVTDVEGKFSFDGLQSGTWTVRSSFSKWLYADVTLELPLAAPVDLVQPPHGFFTGQLLLPANVPMDDVSLWVTPMVGGSPQPTRLDLFMKRDPSEISEDGHFEIGPLPVGEVDVAMMVYSNSADGTVRSGTGPRLGMFPILEGAQQPVEIDVRSTFPSAIHGRVEIDGVAASDGRMRVRAVNLPPPQVTPNASSIELTITGQFQFGGLTPNTPQRLDYTSETGWCWVLPNELQLAAGTDTDQGVIAITTVQREIQIVDATTNLPLANQRIAWRTGLDYGATQDKPEDLQKASATTNAQGKLNVRLPAGPARFVAMPSGTFTPASVDWTTGNAPIVLRFAPQ